jgi:capsular exopolysaccharide synthesis family protein
MSAQEHHPAPLPHILGAKGQRLDGSTPVRSALEDLSDSIDFRRLYHTLLRRWWIIALFTGIVTISTTGYVMRLPQIYESRAVIQVQQHEKQVVKIDNVSEENLSSQDYINTVVESLSSRKLMLRVVQESHLRQNPAFVQPGSNPTDIQLADKMRSKVSVKLRKGTRLIDITVSDTDPVLARDLANSLVNQFLRENIDQRVSVSQVATDFLTQEAEKLKKKLEESESKLQAYKEEKQAVSLEDRQNIIVSRLAELSSKVTEAKGTRLRLEADIEQLRMVSPDDVEDLLRIGSVAAIPQVAETRQELVAANTDFATLQERYGDKHPKHTTAVTRITSLNNTLKESISKAGDILNRQYDSSVQTEAKLNAALKEQEAAALELNKISIPYNVLQRDVETDRALYEAVIARMKETGLTAKLEQIPYTLVEEPLIPSRASKPDRKKLISVAFAFSLILSIGGVLLLDSFNTSFRTVDDAENSLHLPALTGVPNHKPIKVKKANRTGTQRDQYPIANIEAPASTLAEAYRTLRVSLSMLGPEPERRVLLFVSAIPGEGKTYTSLNTAACLAQQGLKTLIVDADLRRPSLQKALLDTKENPAGLTDFFSGNATLEKIVLPTSVPHLFLLPAGSRAPNPAELLASADLKILFENLLKTFDRVIIDTAPVNAVSDTLIIAPHAHKTILVIQSGKTPRKAVLRGAHLLRKAGAKFAGFALNRLPTGRTASYYYYYYGDKYEKDSVYGTKS